MTPQEKLKRAFKLCRELQSEEMFPIIQARISGLCDELKINPFEVGLMFWAMKNQGEFQSIFGSDVRIKFETKKRKQ